MGKLMSDYPYGESNAVMLDGSHVVNVWCGCGKESKVAWRHDPPALPAPPELAAREDMDAHEARCAELLAAHEAAFHGAHQAARAQAIAHACTCGEPHPSPQLAG